MSKLGSPVETPAGFAEWLPLLGTICRILASFDEGSDDDATPREASSGPAPDHEDRR